jgi:hypothetical protein
MKINIQPDFQKAKGIKNVIKNRREFVREFQGKVFPTIICENYYEIIKELATALFLCKGVKFVGEFAHKELIDSTTNLLNLEESFLILLQDLRVRRNGSLYYGELFEESYLINNKNKIELIIQRIDKFLDKELEKNT